MRDIYLHGHLADKFGAHHMLEVATAREAIKALNMRDKEFGRVMRNGSYKVVRGELDSGHALNMETITMRLGSGALHIVPEVSGSGGGTGKAILGVGLIAAAFVFAPEALGATLPGIGSVDLAGGLGETAFTVFGGAVTYGNIAAVGVSMALAGISAALSPRPKAANLLQQATNASFIFDGAVNNSEQGGCVPVWYGEIIVGSTVISGGLEAEQIGVAS